MYLTSSPPNVRANNGNVERACLGRTEFSVNYVNKNRLFVVKVLGIIVIIYSVNIIHWHKTLGDTWVSPNLSGWTNSKLQTSYAGYLYRWPKQIAFRRSLLVDAAAPLVSLVGTIDLCRVRLYYHNNGTPQNLGVIVSSRCIDVYAVEKCNWRKQLMYNIC